MRSYALDPHTYFFGNLVDASSQLEFLHEFASSLDALLVEAAARPPSELAPLPDSVTVVAEDRAYLYSELFPPLVHEAFLISSIIFLERQFRTYVEGLRQALPTLLAFKELSGSALERFRTFCQKVCLLDLGLSPEQWQDLDGLIALRNCLIHSGGFLEGSRDRASCENFVQRHGDPQIVEERLVFSGSSSTLVLRLLTATIEAIYHATLRQFPRKT